SNDLIVFARGGLLRDDSAEHVEVDDRSPTYIARPASGVAERGSQLEPQHAGGTVAAHAIIDVGTLLPGSVIVPQTTEAIHPSGAQDGIEVIARTECAQPRMEGVANLVH